MLVPILNLATEAMTFDLIDAVRIATHAPFCVTLHGQIMPDNPSLYDEMTHLITMLGFEPWSTTSFAPAEPMRIEPDP